MALKLAFRSRTLPYAYAIASLGAAYSGPAPRAFAAGRPESDVPHSVLGAAGGLPGGAWVGVEGVEGGVWVSVGRGEPLV